MEKNFIYPILVSFKNYAFLQHTQILNLLLLEI
jgi:hypothetical protein